ncbi:MAG: type III-B CRISPR module-associated protein Cmr5 [Thiolinea sp.]
MMQTIQQQRAAYALTAVEAAKASLENSSEYKSYASGFPAMIQMNGLGQAAAFYRSKGVGRDSKAQAYLTLYNTLSNWLREPGQPYQDQDLLNGITRENMQTYMLAQAEALALLDWVKKFAKAYMED